MTETPNQPDTPKMFRALALLERRAFPTINGYKAYGRAPLPDPAKSHILIPSWNWTGIHADATPPEDTVTLDVNGSYMAALGGVDIAHGDLKRSVAPDTLELAPRRVLPGYYRIICPNWALDATIVSPLGGDSRHMVGKPIWIAHPTLILLLELMAEGALTYFEIVDCWVSKRRNDFRDWNRLLKQTREGLMDAVDAEHPEGAPFGCKCLPCACYTAFKEGYGAAFAMMRTGERCDTRRPDWADAVYAQHAAARWRNAWRFSAVGPLLFMGSTDELTVRREDLEDALALVSPPLKLDTSGRTLGHYKYKTKAAPEDTDEHQAVTVTGNHYPNTAFDDQDIL